MYIVQKDLMAVILINILILFKKEKEFQLFILR